MILKIIPKQAGQSAIVMEASLVIVEIAEGVPVMVTGEYGPNGVVRSSHANDKDFNDTLNKLGINKTIICDTLQLPAPPVGAKLIRNPKA